MHATEYCPSCNEAVLWKCNSCEKENDKSVHTYHQPKPESSKTASIIGTLISLATGLNLVVPV